MFRLLLTALAAMAIVSSPLLAKSFSVVSYNVENLFDLDGVASYEEYASDKYTPEHLMVKVQNVVRVLAKVDQGAGPDILILNEIELDQTPESTIPDYRAWLDAVKDKKLEDLLTQSPLPDELKGIPADLWLLKACEDAGLTGYQVVRSQEEPGDYEGGRPRSIHNVIFTRFPVLSTQTIATPDARSILEAQLDVDGQPLTVLANHWKSGAGSSQAEAVRVRNARSLRDRLDAIFKENPLADVLVGGDLNSHYNQNSRYPEMQKTGIIDVLGSQGNELALRSGKKDLYNLWFELPTRERGSDVYQDEWGTLMHLIVSRGLYDNQGIQYKDNSFEILRIPGLNSDVFGRPYRWSRGKRPGGFSDHFPIIARFQVADENAKGKWMTLRAPSTLEQGPAGTLRLISSVDLFKKAVKPSAEPDNADFRDGTYDGKVFFIEAPATVNEKGFVSITLNGLEYDIFTQNKELRERIRDMARSKSAIRFYGQLGTYRGRWQFVLHGTEWLADGPSSSLPHRHTSRLALANQS